MSARWPEIDEQILQHRIIPALMIFREEFGLTVHEAIDAFAIRYDHLRESRPDEFTVGPKEYGKGFYS